MKNIEKVDYLNSECLICNLRLDSLHADAFRGHGFSLRRENHSSKSSDTCFSRRSRRTALAQTNLKINVQHNFHYIHLRNTEHNSSVGNTRRRTKNSLYSSPMRDESLG